MPPAIIDILIRCAEHHPKGSFWRWQKLLAFNGLLSKWDVAGRQIAASYSRSMFGEIGSVVSAKNIQPPRFAGGLGVFRRYWVTSGYTDLGYMDFYYCASFAPRLRQAVRASESGVSWQITLSQTSSAPSLRQVSSQVDIHSPSPQP